MRALVLLLLLAGAASATAQALVDPMRPSGTGDADSAAPRPAGPVLEQIVLGDGRRFAVISGRRVSVGDTVGDARVVAIGADQVTLRGGSTQVLRMFPRADKKGADSAPLPRKAEQGS